MSETLLARSTCLTVAVGFDRHTLPLTEAAVDLCRRTGKTLGLLHVVEPWLEQPHSKPLGAGDPLWNVTQAVEDNARELAARKLEELASTVPAEIPVVKRVVSGKPADVLPREALALNSALLLVGADYGNLRFVPRGLSTALSMMVSSTVPVLVVDTSLTPRFTGPRTKILLADDLGPQSESAVDFAFDLAITLGEADLQHVHVNGLTFESLKAGLTTAAAASHTPLDQRSSADDVYQALMHDLQSKLALRAASQREYLEAAGGTYQADVVTGNVSEEINSLATEVNPHLIVFGRHHAYYTKPFFIGRVPYRSMLAHRRPIIIVPNT